MSGSFTSRPPPRSPGDATPSAELAATLRAEPVELDDVTRARMERSVVQAWRMQGAAAVALPRSRMQAAGVRVGRGLLAASFAASAIAGGLFALTLREEHAVSTVPVGSGRFELRIGEAAMQSGAVAEGQMLESGQYGAVDVDLGSARVQMARATRLRFDRMSASELRLSLQRGRIEVDFHPAHKGEQRMVIASAAVDVRVVGTRFVVEVDASSNTRVSVREGVVEVVLRSGAGVKRVAAGEHLEVRADDGDASERAVREAIEAQLGSLARTKGAPEAPPSDGDVDMAFGADEEPAASAAQANTTRRVLGAARRLLRQGRHNAARDRLRGLLDGSTPLRFRVEALTLIAESYTSQGDVPRATEAYQRADALAPRHPAGHNARFALARLLERYAHDEKAAAAGYRRYLERAPDGALAAQARSALCRLGSAEHCD